MSRTVRRLARARLRDAAIALKDARQPLGERVHHLRTSIKKVRALVALARPATGKRAGKADRRLRKMAASAAAARDAEVLLNTFDILLPSLPADAQTATLRWARGRLRARLRETARSFRAGGRIDTLVAKLRRARRATKRWVPRKGAADVAVVGLVDGYRRARRAMRRAYDQPNGAAFHSWRKAVKTHRHQLALWDVWPEPATAAAFESLERLGDVLGEEHDLTVLAQVVGTDRACFPEERDRARLLAVCEERRRLLRGEARQLGERLFAERPRAFGRRVRHELGVRPPGQVEDPPEASDRKPKARPSGRPVLRLA